MKVTVELTTLHDVIENYIMCWYRQGKTLIIGLPASEYRI